MTDERRDADEVVVPAEGIEPPPPPTGAVAGAPGDRWRGLLRSLTRQLVVPALSVFTAMLLGAVIIVVSDPALLADPLASVGRALAAYGALISGSLGSPNAISETLLQATPLIFAALAVALGFRSGLFNIGAEGQLFLGAAFAIYAGFSLTGLPSFIHLPVALAAGVLGGALWGFIPGLLKARTGAHEVITTIMLNFVAFRLVDWLLNQAFFQREGRTDQISKIIEQSAVLPRLLPDLRAHWGLILALAAAVFVSWLLFRSTKGFEFRAVGLNPSAARYAGINISRTIVLTMMVSGGLAGLAGATVMLGSTHTLTPGFSPGWGFDAIALALLGGSRPLGVVFAALLFGALRAGSTPMQLATDIPIDLVVIVQALVIMFIAAPALVRAIYRIRVDRRTTGAEVFSKGWGA